MNDDLNLLLSNLNVLYRKLQNFHWYVKGKNFFVIHEKLEEYYDDVNKEIDEIAEHMLSRDFYVMATMKEYLETSQIKEAESKKICSQDLINIVIKDFETLVENFKKIKEEADNENAYTTSSLMDEYMLTYKKKLWMLNQMCCIEE